MLKKFTFVHLSRCWIWYIDKKIKIAARFDDFKELTSGGHAWRIITPVYWALKDIRICGQKEPAITVYAVNVLT